MERYNNRIDFFGGSSESFVGGWLTLSVVRLIDLVVLMEEIP
jgi:hypothetical protein